MTTADLVVVGGGVIGAGIAHAAARDGVRTLLLERGRLGTQASEGSMGGLHWVHMPDEATLALALAGLERYPGLADELGERFALKPVDYLGLVLDPAGLPDAVAHTVRAAARGLALRLLNVSEAGEVQPGVTWDGVAGALHGSTFHVNVTALTRAYAGAARRSGARVLEDVAVHGAHVHDDHVAALETTVGRIACGAVVVAAGAWTRSLLRTLGGPDLAIYHSHSQYADAVADSETLGELGLRTIIFSAGGVHEESSRRCAEPAAVTKWDGTGEEDIVPPEHDLGIMPMAGGGVRIGQVTRMIPGFVDRVSADDGRRMVQEASRRFPPLQRVRRWEPGVRAVAFTPDGIPCAGFVARPGNVFVCAGFISPVILVPPLADHVSQAVQRRSPPPALREFAPRERPLSAA